MSNDTKYPARNEVTRLKSKAQQYADATKLAVSMIPKPHQYAKALDDGRLYLYDGFLTQEEALSLRDWLTDTFDTPVSIDTPKIPGRQPGWSRED